MSNSLLRLKQMLLGWGTVGVIYNFSDYLQGEGYQLTPSIIDNLIAFSPSAVWLYLSFFFIVPLVTPLCRTIISLIYTKKKRGESAPFNVIFNSSLSP